MLLFYINDVKPFMNALIKSDLFDAYEARGIILQTFTRFEISCVREAETPAEGEKPGYCAWGELRERLLDLIKGKIQPKYLKIILCLSGAEALSVHKNAASLHMTITYENGAASVLTGVSQKEFSLDKELDSAWDNIVTSFFAEKGIGTRESAE